MPEEKPVAFVLPAHNQPEESYVSKLPLMTVLEEVPAPLTEIAPACNVPTLSERLESEEFPPTQPENVMSPEVVAINAKAPSTVDPNKILPAPEDRVVSAPSVTAPVYVCKPLVVMVPAKVLVPFTVKLEGIVPVAVICALASAMFKVLMVWVFCRFKIAPAAITTELTMLSPKVPAPVTAKVPALIVVIPV